MQKKIYSLMYDCALDNLNSIWQNGSQATTWVLRKWLFSSKRYKSEKCQLHWLYLRREDLNKKTSNVLKIYSVETWYVHFVGWKWTFLSPTIEHVADTWTILSFDIVNVSFQRPRDLYSNQTFMVKTFILIVGSQRSRLCAWFSSSFTFLRPCLHARLPTAELYADDRCMCRNSKTRKQFDIFKRVEAFTPFTFTSTYRIRSTFTF